MSNFYPDIVIYHDHCADGATAAWVAYAASPPGKEPHLVPASYGERLYDLFAKSDRFAKNPFVLMADMSLPAHELRELCQTSRAVVILDHHASAERNLENFRIHGFSSRSDTESLMEDLKEVGSLPIAAFFDMQKSGGRMTWDFYHPNTEPPELVKITEDRDLWRFLLPETKPVSAYLSTQELNQASLFQVMEDVHWRLSSGHELREQLISTGTTIELTDTIRRKEALKVTRRVGTVAQYTVPIFNLPPRWASDALNEALQAEPEVSFVASYYDGPKGRSFSLRSQDHRVDVSKVAEYYGGGGHRNAAGFLIRGNVPVIL